MSIWKKFASLLFEETDADVIAEDELEDISFPEEETIKYKKPVYSPKPQEQPVVEKREPESIITPVKEEKKFVSIEIGDEEPKQREHSAATSTNVKARSVRGNVERVEKSDYEVSPVISPIFGSREEQGKTMASSIRNMTLPKPKKPNPLGTVISPYYGLGELEEFKAEAQEEIELKEKIRHEEPVIENMDMVEEEEDINSLSLDDLIMDNDVEEDEDDLMQISLFGESTPLRDSDTAVDEKQKEV